jgi:hypothetical protein
MTGFIDKKGDFKITGFINLNNVIIGDKEYTTVDHDGVAVVLFLVSSR